MAETTKPKMPTASALFRIQKHGHDVPLSGITPAELLLLVAMHHPNAGGNPVVEGTLKPGVDVERSAGEEVARLRTKYAADKVNAMFGEAAIPNLPSSFDEAIKLGVAKAMPTNRMAGPTA